MPAAVGALGSLAGGLAAKAIMGTPPTAQPDTSIPGVTSATIKKGYKGGQGISVAQIDPTNAINYFKQAAATSKDYYTQGLDMYGASIAQAIGTINNNYAQANYKLAGTAQAGQDALNRELQWMGLPAMSQSAGIGDALANIGDFPELQKQLTAAEQLTDPNQRAAAKQQILNALQSAKIGQVQSAAAPGAPPDKPVYDVKKGAQDPNYNAQYYAQYNQWLKDIGYTGSVPTGFNGGANLTNEQQKQVDQLAANAKAKYQTDMANYQQQQQADQLKAAQNAIHDSSIDNIYNQFDRAYGTEAPQTISPGDVKAQLEATPGYQFTFDQGSQAIQRSALAHGNLMSGNTAMALTQFGQQLGDTTFQQALSNLASIATQGLPAQGQIASNYVNEGKDLSSLYTMAGGAAMQTYGNIGNQYANSLNNAGEATYNATAANVAAQNAALTAYQAQQGQMAQQAIASGPAYMNAQTLQNQQNYQVFQNQQAGNTFAGGGGGYNILPVGGVSNPGNPVSLSGLNL